MFGKKLTAAAGALFIIIIALLTLLLAFWCAPPKHGKQVSSETRYPIIIIDAGHGGEDGGAVGADGTYEKDLNLDISIKLGDMLRANGVPVILTRTEDILLYDRNTDFMGRKKVLDLKARMKVSTDNPGAIFISIHMNAFPQKKYSGLQVWYSEKNEAAHSLAKLIQHDVVSSLQPDNTRKPKPADSSIYLLDKNPNSALLIECGFLSNVAECTRLNDPEYRRRLSLVLFCSMMKYLDNAEESP